MENRIADLYELTPLQEGMLFHWLYDPASSAYIQQISYRVDGKALKMNTVEQALRFLVARYDVLRTVFAYEDLDQPLQIVLNKSDDQVQYLDLTSESEQNKPGKINDIKAEDKRKGFDLSKDPLLRLTVIRVVDSEYEFVWTYHHIIMDGWCLAILLEDFNELYESLLENRPHRLKPAVQFKEYIEWRRKYSVNSNSYWLDLLADYEPNSEIPGRRKHSKIASEKAALKFNLTQDVTDRLRELAATKQSTLSTLIQCLWGLLYSKYNNCTDVVIGSVVSGRPSEIFRIETMVGLLINTIPVRITFNSDTTFISLINSLQEQALRSQPHHYFSSLPEIKAASGIKGEIFDHVVAIDNYPIVQQLAKSSAGLMQIEEGTINFEDDTNYDFSITVTPVNGLSIHFAYDQDKFDVQILKSLAGHFQRLAESVLANPNKKIDEISLVELEELDLALGNINRSISDHALDATIPQLFEQQVTANPSATAVVFGDQKMTYEGLNARSNNVCQNLLQRDTRPEELVAVVADNSCELIIAILGVLKAGAAYVPLDPAYSAERMRFVVDDGNIEKILIHSKSFDKSSLEGCELIEIGEAALGSDTTSPQDVQINPESLAYIMYTSGSSGEPKGVMIEHRNVIQLVKNQNYARLDQTNKLVQTGSISFDATTFEFWGILLNGGELHIVERANVSDAFFLKEYFLKHQINIMFFTTALFNEIVNIDPTVFEPLEVLMVGGDTLSVCQINTIKKKYPALKLLNVYGPTENTTYTTFHNIEREYEHLVPIGRPISNSRVLILDQNLNPVPIGASGELCIVGGGVARGYLHRAELTKEKFIEYEKFGGRLYRTGDMVRWNSEKYIEFLGRLDQQVKIRGHRIELGEIEYHIRSFPQIDDCVVDCRSDKFGNKYLCAYYVSKQLQNERQLISALSARLPSYMVPPYFMRMQHIPLKKNGKIERRHLPEPVHHSNTQLTPPSSETEKTMLRIWSEVLGVEEDRLGIQTNFFEAGGHSLKATVLSSKIQQSFNVIVPLVEIFHSPFISTLSEYVKSAIASTEEQLQQVEPKAYYRCSSVQKRLYLLHQIDMQSLGYNIPAFFSVQGDLNTESLQENLRSLMARHEILRTKFVMVNGVPMQQVLDQIPIQLEVYHEDDLSFENACRNFIRPFDLTILPLFRAGLFHANEKDSYVLMFDIHHIISDGVSSQIMIDELTRINKEEKLPSIKFQYKEYAEWQHSSTVQEKKRHAREFWIKDFSGSIPVLELPYDFTRPVVKQYAGGIVDFTISGDELNQIRVLLNREGVTMYILLLAIYNVLLGRISNQEDVVVGTPTAGRSHTALERMLGAFINTLPLRNFPEAELPFKEFLQKVKERTLACFDHQQYQYDDLIDDLSVVRDTGRNPLFDVMLVVQNMERKELEISGLKLQPLDHHQGISKFDLTLHAYEDSGILNLGFEYSSSLFKRETVMRFVDYFKSIIRKVVSDPSIQLGNIDILTAQEKEDLLKKFQGASANYPQKQTIHRLFEEQVERSPKAPALVCGNQQITYQEINEKANGLALKLRTKGVVPESVVAIMMERSVDAIVAILAVLKSGGAYLPIDPSYPQDRVKFMMDDSHCNYVITRSQFEGLTREGQQVLFLDKTEMNAVNENLKDVNHPESLAYIIYTSGSTGIPKGAMVEHRNVVRLMINDGFLFNFDNTDVWTLFHSFSFDFSVWEIWGALLYGGKLVLVEEAQTKDLNRFSELIVREKVTVLNQTPSAFYSLLSTGLKAGAHYLRYVIFGGEALNPAKLKDWSRENPNVKLINMYGITETTIHVTYKEMKDEDLNSNASSIGRPIPTTRVIVVNKFNQLQPINTQGEMLVGGLGVGRGYFGKEELTRKRFISTTYFNGEPVYRSGDLAKVLPNGELEYVGRQDHQVKVRGYRIELGEIEAQVLTHPHVRESVVITKGTDSSKYLCCYVVLNAATSEKEIVDFLRSKLPSYMVPQYVIEVEAIPLTANKKVDVQSLPEPDLSKYGRFSPPENELQKKLAAIWSTVLLVDVAAIGMDTSFFDLGGNSLAATMLLAEIHKEFDAQISLIEIFKRPTIREISDHIVAIQWVLDSKSI